MGVAKVLLGVVRIGPGLDVPVRQGCHLSPRCADFRVGYQTRGSGVAADVSRRWRRVRILLGGRLAGVHCGGLRTSDSAALLLRGVRALRVLRCQAPQPGAPVQNNAAGEAPPRVLVLRRPFSVAACAPGGDAGVQRFM